MSEWYDSQKKPNSNFRKLLQERIDKANPRRTEPTKEEQQKLGKLNGILDTLICGENMQNPQLQHWLTKTSSWERSIWSRALAVVNFTTAEMLNC